MEAYKTHSSEMKRFKEMIEDQNLTIEYQQRKEKMNAEFLKREIERIVQ